MDRHPESENPTSRLMIHILDAVAEFERSGIVEAKRAGKHCGRLKKL